jgi:hypothetical protein
MGNESSVQRSKESREDEALLKTAASSGDVTAVEALLRKDPLLVYAHTKDGKNVWHLAAEAGHAEVRCRTAPQIMAPFTCRAARVEQLALLASAPPCSSLTASLGGGEIHPIIMFSWGLLHAAKLLATIMLPTHVVVGPLPP